MASELESVVKVGGGSAGAFLGVSLLRGIVGAALGGVAGYAVAALAIGAAKKVFSPVRQVTL